MILKKNTVVVAKRNPKILIINPFGIGDVLFTTPVIRAIKAKYPDSFIGYWCNLRVKPLLVSNPGINKIFALSRGDIKKLYQESFFSGLWYSLKLVFKLKKEHFDICLDFSLDHRYSLFSKIIGIRRRFGFNYKGRGRFLTGKIDITGYQYKHAVEYYLDLLHFLGIEPKDKNLELPVPEQFEIRAKDMLTARGIEDKDLIIGIAPGAGGSWGKDAGYKHWPPLKFARLADKLINEFKAKILILGDNSEQQITDVIVGAMRAKPVDLTGKIDLEEFPAIIKNLQLLICNDGGPMHIAVALGVKTVAIFGPVSEVTYGPYPASKNHIVLKWDIDCRPCYKNFRLPLCDKDKECLRAISVDSVFEAAAKLLS
ncbi:MAG: glycosyltransferase family 9 protein [Candidatus Omnitrophica bacterium]|nr:glycosyltransferase family 9 protein [Candidatus Omnitrophota bacterium]